MHRRTRGLVVAMAAVMALASACGSGSGGGKKLDVLVGVNNTYPAQQRAWMAQMQQQFKAKTGADLQFETFSTTSEETSKIQTSAVSGSGPDVYSLGSSFVATAYATRAFQVLSDADWQKIGGRNQFIPQSMTIAGPDPQHDIAVPMEQRPYGMVYNTTLFRNAGIAEPPKTWDEFVDDAKRLTNPAAGVYGTVFDYGDNTDPWKYIWTFGLQSGGQLVSPDLKKAELNSPQFVNAVRSYFDLPKLGIADPKSVSFKSPQALSAFADGKAAMLAMVTPNAVPTLDSGSVKGQYAFAPMPLVPFGATSRPPGGVPAGSIVSGDYLSVASYSSNKDLALTFISMVTNPDEQKQYFQTFGDLPSNQQAAEDEAKASPITAAMLDSEHTSIATPFTGAWADIQLGLTNTVTQSLPGLTGAGYDPAAVQQLMDKANQQVQASLDRQGR
jgi:multiple sugar transport system substrate-binding protein